MKNKISTKAKYKVKALFDDATLFSKILISYYLPIINPNAFSLYAFLMCETKNNALNTIFISVDRITDALNITFEALIEALEKLELVNLIDILADKNQKIIFCLKKPLSPTEFNNSIQMKELLLSKIGKQNIEISNNVFNSMKNNYIENFKSITNEMKMNVKMGINSNSKLNVTFDFDSIKSIITAKGIDWSRFWSPSFEEQIMNIIIIHDISIVDLAMEIIEEFQTNDFNIKHLKSKIEKAYSKKILIDNLENSKESKMSFLESMSVYQYFINKLERKPSSSELKLIKRLKEEYSFIDHVINILLDYSIIVNNGAINKNYILKISNTLLKEGIKTPEDVIKHLKVSYKMKKKGKTKKTTNSKIEMKDKPIF